jgi:hypothetical protein
MRHTLSAIYANAEFLERHNLCASGLIWCSKFKEQYLRLPPGYQRQQPIKRPKLGPWMGVIGAILNDDKQRPAKQRHTSVTDYVRAAYLT